MVSDEAWFESLSFETTVSSVGALQRKIMLDKKGFIELEEQLLVLLQIDVMGKLFISDL